MSIKRKIRLMTLVSALLAGANFGCGGGDVLGGGATNNDQGTSFLAFGYFGDTTGSVGVTGLQTFLAADNNVTAGFQGTVNGIAVDGRRSIVFMGLQNRLATQYIRVTRIDCDYTVPGADPSLSIPSDSFNTGAVISAAGTTNAAGGPTAGQAPRAFLGFNVISTDIYSFLNVNRNSLPELPFRMLMECRAVGVTQAGDVFVSNPLAFNTTFFDSAECCTGATLETPGNLGGFEIAPGTGGTPLAGINATTGDPAAGPATLGGAVTTTETTGS